MWLVFNMASTFFWAWVNVLDSMLVRRYEKNPVVLMWAQSLISVPILILFALFFDVKTPWMWALMAGGLGAYGGDLVFFSILGRLDASITNAAWAIMAILLSIVGFIFFKETWSILQTLGTILILTSVLVLAFWHKHISFLRTFGLLFFLAACYVPTYSLKKAAVFDGQPAFAVFFWLVLSRELMAFLFPWSIRSLRERIMTLRHRISSHFFVIGGLIIVLFFLGEYLGAKAYQVGTISLVAVSSNVQPFMVITLAWLLSKYLPSLAPRELLTAHSVAIKLIGFLGVFVGLALLSFSL